MNADESFLQSTPFWALETLELLLRELGETETAALYKKAAAAKPERRIWRDSFPAVEGKIEKRILPEIHECSPVDAELLARAVETVRQLMPGYELREGQTVMLHAVAQALNTQKHLLAEAGTGVGKSLAYLLPAALWALFNDIPIVVSTNTRNLQTQLIEKDLPLVREALKKGCPELGELRGALLKGRSNYLCLRRFGLILDQGQFEFDRNEKRQFAEVVRWAVRTSDGDLDALSGEGKVDVSFLSHLASPGEECPGRGCRFFRRCFLQRARMRAAKAHIVVANHALVFSDLQTPGSALPLHHQVIFDEAHNLEDAATRHLSIEFSPAVVLQLLRRLSSGGKKQKGVLEALASQLNEDGTVLVGRVMMRLDELRTAALHLFRIGTAFLEGRETRRYRRTDEVMEVSQGRVFIPSESLLPNEIFIEAVKQFTETCGFTAGDIHKLAVYLSAAEEGELGLHSDQAAGLEGAVTLINELAMSAQFVTAGTDPGHIFWMEPSKWAGHAVCAWYAAPLDISSRLCESLFKKKASAVLCSATLRVADSFDHFMNRSGLGFVKERVLSLAVQSPFDYSRKCRVLALPFLPEPGGNPKDTLAYIERLSSVFIETGIVLRGRTLGLFTSYDMMRQVGALIEEPLRAAGVRLLMQGSGESRDFITRRFRTDEQYVLLGTHSFWEGVDVVGEALSCVIMARLPFAAVGDPIIEARSEQIDRRGGSSFRELSLPNAVMKFRQGFGRLIRSAADRGLVVIADPRIVTKGYGATFRKSLPCGVISLKEQTELDGHLKWDKQGESNETENHLDR